MSHQVEQKKRQVEIASYMLGMLSLLILGNKIGEDGVAYTAVSFEVFLFFEMCIGSRLADTIGKLLRARTAKGQYKNAEKLKRNVMFTEFLAGLSASVLFFIVTWFVGKNLPGGVYHVAIMQLLAPAVVLHTLVCVLLGYFQAEGTELPSVISYVMRQVCILLFSLLLIHVFGGYGQKVSTLLRQEHFTAMYSGMGVALAITLSEVFVLIFLFLVYRSSRGKTKKNNGEGLRTTDTFGSQMSALLRSVCPMVVIALLRHLPIWFGILFFYRAASENGAWNVYGVYYGKYLPVMGLCVFPALIFLLGYGYRVVGSLRKDEQRYARNYFSNGLHFAIVYGLFVSVFVAMLATPIADLIGAGEAASVADMLRFGSFLIGFAAIGYYFVQIMLLMNGKLQVMGVFAGRGIVFLIALIGLLHKDGIGVFALIYAGLIAAVVYAVTACILVCYQMRFGVDWARTLALPAGAACVAGLLLFFVGRGISPHLGNLLAILLCLVLGGAVYLLILLCTRNFTETELTQYPGGKFLLMIGRLLRLY